MHLRSRLKDLYWKADRPEVQALQFWEDTQRFIYLPRLKDRETLASAIRTGSSAKEFFGTAMGKTEGKYEGFKLGEAIYQTDDTLVLIEPGVAAEYAAKIKNADPKPGFLPSPDPGPGFAPSPGPAASSGTSSVPSLSPGPGPVVLKNFHSTAEIPAASSKVKLLTLADDIIAVLGLDPTAKVRITVEISAEFPNGVSDNIKRAINENANGAGLKTKEWE